MVLLLLPLLEDVSNVQTNVQVVTLWELHVIGSAALSGLTKCSLRSSTALTQVNQLVPANSSNLHQQVRKVALPCLGACYHGEQGHL
jgi:hypothetical protein